MTSIEQLTPEDFDLFLTYLNDHLSDNGRDGTGSVSYTHLTLPTNREV